MRPFVVMLLVALVGGCGFPRATFVDAGETDAAADSADLDAASQADAVGADATVPDASSVDGGGGDGAVVDAPLDAASPMDAIVDAAGSGDASWDPIPPDVPTSLRFPHNNMALPPSGWTSAGGWMQTIHDARLPGASSVDIDSVELFAVTSSGEVLLAGATGMRTGIDWANTWTRAPWYDPPSQVVAPWNPFADIVTFVPSDDASRVWGWGTARPMSLPPGTTHCVLRALVRISGPALVQAGIDYWDGQSGSQSVQAGVGAWYYQASGWQLIEVDLSL